MLYVVFIYVDCCPSRCYTERGNVTRYRRFTNIITIFLFISAFLTGGFIMGCSPSGAHACRKSGSRKPCTADTEFA